MTIDVHNLIFKPTKLILGSSSTGDLWLSQPRITITIRAGNMSVVSISIGNEALANYLDTEADPGTPYEPQYPWSPATKKYVDDSISTTVASAYKYKWSVASYSNLPASGNTEGDVWNVTDTGMNYAWTWSAWDALGATVDLSNYIAKNNTTAFTPSGDYNPSTKKYVDDTVASAKSSWATAPSNPTEWQLWYDTTNDVLKVYDWTNWNVVWDDAADINTKTFVLSSDSDKATATEAYKWYSEWNYPIIIRWNSTFVWPRLSGNDLVFTQTEPNYNTWNTTTLIQPRTITFTYDTSTEQVTQILYRIWWWISVLETNKNYSTPYTPAYSWSPATKKYVDDSVSWAVSKWTTAPSSPVEWQLWYDTTNDVLKSYNWTTWVEVGWWSTTNVLRFDIWERYWLNDLIWQSVANIVNAWYELWTGTQWKNTIILSANNWQYRTYDFLVTSVSDRIPWPDEEQWWAIHAIWYYNSDEFCDSMPQSLCYLDIYYNTETKICTNIQEFTQSPITRLDSPFPLDFIWVWTEADYQDITEPHPQTLYLTMDIPLKSYQEIVAMTNVQDVYNELNLQPARYIQKFTSEWHFYNSANWKWLSSDWTIWNIPTWWNYRVRVASWMDTFDFTTTAPAP